MESNSKKIINTSYSLKSNDNKRKNNNVLKKMKIGGKNIFKPKIIQDNSQSRYEFITNNI